VTRISALSALAAFATLAMTTSALAQTTPKQCEQSYDLAQRDHAAHKHLAARDEARACTAFECNAAISAECMKLYELIQSELPSLVFSAHDPDGKELFDVQVTLDGKPALANLDGSAFELDPGIHTVRFEAKNQPPVETTLAARIGDHNRLVDVTIGQPKPKPAAPPPVAPAPISPPSVEKHSGPPAVAYVLAGGGVVALGIFGYLQLRAHGDYNDLVDTCKPTRTCDPASVDAVRSKVQLSYIPLGIGIAAIGTAVTLFALPHHEGSTSGGADVALTTTSSGAGARLRMRF
jgi:hypothetical protein